MTTREDYVKKVIDNVWKIIRGRHIDEANLLEIIVGVYSLCKKEKCPIDLIDDVCVEVLKRVITEQVRDEQLQQILIRMTEVLVPQIYDTFVSKCKCCK